MNIDKYKADHVTIMRLVTDLRQLVLDGVEKQPAAIAQKVVAISSTIKMHLIVEDQVLYPAMRRSEAPTVAQTAIRFQKEMGPLADDFTVFARRWNTELRVKSEPVAMHDEALAMISRIRLRMQQENQELYPLAEKF